MIEQRAGETLALVERMREVFETGAVKVAVLPFDAPADAQCVIQAARESGIRTLDVQHGFFNEPKANYREMTLADSAAVWSEADARDVRARGGGSVVVTGNPGIVNAAEVLLHAPQPRSSGDTLMLVEYSSRLSIRLDNRVSMRHVNTALRALAVARPGSSVTVRPHPAEHEPQIFARTASLYPTLDVRVDSTTSIEDLLRVTDLCIGAVSTATLQAACAGVPVVFLNVTGRTAPWPFDGSTDVPVALSESELAALIPVVLSTDTVLGRAAMLDALGVKRDAIDRVVDLIRTLAKKAQP
jgi:hypothetical protein